MVNIKFQHLHGGHIAQLKNVLKNFKIENHSRIAALNGQYGVRTLMDIPRNTCVGQYIGAEILQKAFGILQKAFGVCIFVC